MSELEPCRKCGSEAEIIYKEAPSNIIHCSYCNQSTGNLSTWQETVEDWNVRHVSDKMRECIRDADILLKAMASLGGMGYDRHRWVDEFHSKHATLIEEIG